MAEFSKRTELQNSFMVFYWILCGKFESEFPFLLDQFPTTTVPAYEHFWIKFIAWRHMLKGLPSWTAAYLVDIEAKISYFLTTIVFKMLLFCCTLSRIMHLGLMARMIGHWENWQHRIVICIFNFYCTKGFYSIMITWISQFRII